MGQFFSAVFSCCCWHPALNHARCAGAHGRWHGHPGTFGLRVSRCLPARGASVNPCTPRARVVFGEAAPMARGSTYQVQPMVSKVMRPVTAKSDCSVFFFFFFSLSLSLSISQYIYIYIFLSLSLCLSIFVYIYIYISLSRFSFSLALYIYISFHIRSLFLAEICQSQPRQSPG